MTVPYLMGQSVALDFSPFTNALAQYRDQRSKEAQRLMQERQFQQGVSQFNATNALARDQFGLAQLTAERAEAKAPIERDLLLANIELTKRKADSYGALSQARRNALAPQPVADSTAGMALREDGSLYATGGYEPLSGGLGGGGSLIQGDDPEYGPIGRQPVSVPGIVTTPKGVSDRLATQASEGQRALGAAPDADRARFLEYKQLQDQWSHLHGKRARPGHMYDRTGREVPIGPLSKSGDDAERKDRAINNMLGQINQAEKDLLDSSGIARAAAGALKEAGPIGRFANNMIGLEKPAEALGKYKEGVLQTVYALSGKQTTNKEMEAFLNLYMPQAGESDKLIQSKTARLRRMLKTLQSKVRPGMVFEIEDLRAALEESRTADFDKNQGRMPSSEPKATPRSGADRLKNKYGLE